MRFNPATAVAIKGALFLVLIGGAVQVHAQDRDPGRFLRWTYHDATSFVVDAGTTAPLLAFAGAVVLVPTAQLDSRVLRGVQGANREPLQSYLRTTNELGGPRTLPVVTGIFALSLTTHNTRFQDAAFTSLQSLIFAGAITKSLKFAFGRHRPESNDGAFRFDSFSGHSSFPSGHTTAAFAVITPWVLYYPNTATYGLFAVGAGTAVARVAFDKHWPTDVLAGAAIGILTARYLTYRHLSANRQGPDFEVTPTFSDMGTGIRLRLGLQ